MKQVTLLFLRKPGYVLLAMKKRGFGQGMWNGAGGKVEPGETVKAAAIRECQEEIGVTPQDCKLAGRFHFTMPHKPSLAHDCFVFTASHWEGEPAETEEMRPQWFKTDAIPYESMWPADSLWMPHLIADELFMGHIKTSETQLVSHDIKIVPAISDQGMPSRPHQSNTTFEEINALIWQHLEERNWNGNPSRGIAVSIALEANELLEHYQWSDTPVGTREELAAELADILIYAFQFAQENDIDIAEAIRKKLKKAAEKYPAKLFKNAPPDERRAAWLAAKKNYKKTGL